MVTLTTAAGQSSALDSDSSNGLQLQIDKCSKHWRKTGHHVYVCHGVTDSVIPSRPVIGSDVPLAGIAELQRPHRKVHLLLTLTLPPTAPAALENLSSTLSYTFAAA